MPRAPLLWLLLAGLLVSGAPRGQAAEGPTVSGKELARTGFFQDFDELDLEALLETASATTSVATRRESNLNETPAAVSVVNDTQLQARGARTLEDVLRLLPGFEVLRDSLGQPRIVVRGSGLDGSVGGSEGVLVLLNGQRLNEAVSGSATLMNLDLSVQHVRRIEIWRGAASSFYGSGAQRAVINVVTHSAREFQGIELMAAGGSFETQNYALRLGNTFKGLSFSGLIEFADTKGARLGVASDRQTALDRELAPFGIAPASLAPGVTHEGRQLFQSTYVLGYGDFNLQWHSVREQSDAALGFADTLGEGNDLDRRQTSFGLGYRRSLASGRVEAHVGLTRSKDSQTLSSSPPGFALPLEGGGEIRFPSGVFLQSKFEVSRLDGEALVERRAGNHTLVAGVELGRDSSSNLDVKSNLDYRDGGVLEDVQSLAGAVSDRTRSSFGAYLHDNWSPGGRLSLNAGLRFDHLSDAGEQVSPRAALVFEARDSLSLRLLYARSFRAPSFDELYYSFPGRIGNPDLLAPATDSLEAGLNFRLHDLNVTAQGFWSRERDPIRLLQPFDPALPQQWVNAADLRGRGLELELERTFGLENSFFLNYTWQHVEQDGSGGSVRAPGVPSGLANAGLSMAVGTHLLASPTLSWRSKRPRAPGDVRAELPGYALFDLALRVRRLYRSLEFAAGVRNLFDERYSDPSGLGGAPADYPRAGRSAYVLASYRF